uniref:MCM10 OB-fold domain-containing protein n=1 Tax=Pyrodinium bahamense TaxID=73915 RepID=A0A7S0AHG7_9DINO
MAAAGPSDDEVDRALEAEEFLNWGTHVPLGLPPSIQPAAPVDAAPEPPLLPVVCSVDCVGSATALQQGSTPCGCGPPDAAGTAEAPGTMGEQPGAVVGGLGAPTVAIAAGAVTAAAVAALEAPSSIPCGDPEGSSSMDAGDRPVPVASGRGDAAPPRAGSKASGQDLASSSEVRPLPTPQQDREEYTGLRIAKRSVGASQWHEEISGRGRRVVQFRQLSELFRRRQECDRVVVGVLYEKMSSEKLANGERFACWSLTDLAEPKPRYLKLHLRWEAFQHWRSRQAAPNVTRGSIFAIMNPALVDDGRGSAMGSEPVLRVDRAAQLHKLGECPSLGRCSIKGCALPCNVDLDDRFCQMHLARAYADKPCRIVAGGGIESSTASLLKGCRSLHKPRARAPLPAAEEGEVEDVDGLIEEANQLKTKVAIRFDDRRLHHSEAIKNYKRAICSGVRPDEQATSRVPLLGRGLEGPGGLELDLATVDRSERRKAERMLSLRATDRLATGAMAGRPPLQQRAKRPRPDTRSEPLAMPPAAHSKSRRVAGAAADAGGAEARPPCGPDPGAAGTADDGGAAAGSGPVPDAAGIAEPGPESASGLLQSLEAAAGDAARLRGVLEAAEGLPASALREDAGPHLYAAVGQLTLNGGCAEIKRLALRARRRWRAQSEVANLAAPPGTAVH